MMDTITLSARIISCMVCLAVLAETSNSDWLDRSVRSAQRNRNKRRHTNVNNNEIVEGGHFLQSFKDSKASTDCCFNGGLCIMNTFCHCPQGFHGRYCEHKTHDRSCGTIKHGTWMAKGCFLCHCFDGKMRCKTTQIPNCEHISYAEGIETSPEYQVDVDKKFADYERFYDLSDDEVIKQAASGSALPVPVSISGCLVAMSVTVFVGLYG